MVGELVVHGPATETQLPEVDRAQQLFEPFLPCDEPQLRRVYLRLALQFHPDKWPEARRLEATRLFQAIAATYERILRPSGHRLERRVKTVAAAAAELGDVAELRKLLDQIPSRANEVDENGATPLMFAAKGGCVEAVELLLERGAELDATNLLGWSALLWGALSDQFPVVELLLGRGAKVNEHILILSTFVGSARSLEALINEFPGHAGELRTDTNGQSLLHLVCFGMCNLPRDDPERYITCAELLVRHGVPVDLQDKRGQTCLHVYVSHPHWTKQGFEQSEARMALVERLCNYGASVRLENHEGRSALSIAATRGLGRLLKLLRDYEEGSAGSALSSL